MFKGKKVVVKVLPEDKKKATNIAKSIRERAQMRATMRLTRGNVNAQYGRVTLRKKLAKT